MSANELAIRVGVSQPSVTRFAQSLGFPGYLKLVRYLQSQTAWNDNGEDCERNHYQQAAAAEIRHLEALAIELKDGNRLAAIGAELAASRPLCVLGLRSAAAVASYCAFFAGEVHPDVRLLIHEGSSACNDLLRAREAGSTWLVVFALPRVPRATLDAVCYARSIGFRMVSVTARPVGVIAQESEIVLPVSVGTDLLFDSHAGPMVLAAALVDAMAAAVPTYSQRRLEAFEDLAETTGIFASLEES